MGRDKYHKASYPILKQFYSLTERFLYDYDYEFTVPIVCTLGHLVAKALQDLLAYSVYEHDIFLLSINFLHPTPKDVQNNNYRVHETKLMHKLIYYTFFSNKNHYTQKSYIHINDQLTSPYFLNYGYNLKPEFMTGTLRNFDPIKNYCILQPKYAPQRPLIVPLEALQPFEEYHTFHLEGSVTNKTVLNRAEFHASLSTTDLENEVRKTVKASITKISIDTLTDVLADLLSKDDHFVKEYKHYKNHTNHPDQTEIL